MTEDDLREQELIAQTLIGDEAETFLESELGRCLIGMAVQDVMDARNALETINPTDVQAIERLQNKAKLGRQFKDYLIELKTRGETALKIWNHERNDNARQ